MPRFGERVVVFFTFLCFNMRTRAQLVKKNRKQDAKNRKKSNIRSRSFGGRRVWHCERVSTDLPPMIYFLISATKAVIYKNWFLHSLGLV